MIDFTGLRITLVGPLAPPSGGMSNQLLYLVENLRRAQAIVEIVQCNAPYRPRWIGSVPVVRAGFRLLQYIASLRRAVRRSEICHVLANSGWSWHLFAVPAIWVASRYRVPVIVHYHGGEASEFLARSAHWVRRPMSRVRQVVVPSEYLAEVFRRFDIPTRIVSNLVDLERFSPAKRPPGEAPHVVVARNLEPIYDNETAIRAFAELLGRWPSARLTIAGGGADRARLEALVKELSLQSRVTFAGRLEREQMAALFQSADLSLNPSRIDNMPVSILEAMASGVPVVSTNAGGIPYLARNEETALLVDPGDPTAMAGAATRMLSDAPLRARIVAAALETVAACSWPQTSAKWLAVYRDALAARTA